MNSMKRKNYMMKIVMFIMACSVMLPLVIIGIWSVVMRWPWPNLIPTGLTTRGFVELFGSHSDVLAVTFSSIMLSIVVAMLSTIIGFMSAHAFAFYDFIGKTFLRFGSLMPIIVPANVFAMGIYVSFIKWNIHDTIAAVIIAHLIYSLPYSINILTEMRIMYGYRYEQQAQVLGCNSFQAFQKVTLPIVFPALASSFSMAYIISYSQYFLTLLIGGGKVKTLSIIMVPFISAGDRTIASAYAMLFLLSSLSVFVIFEYFGRRTLVKNIIRD